MDGLHDLGGKQGFGRVKYPSAPHNESWRPLVRGLHAFAIESHIYSMDEFRHAIERMTPRHYISAPYFERHLTAIATLLIEKGIATREELESLVDGEFPLSAPLGPGRLPSAPQSFAIGETVRVKNEFVPVTFGYPLTFAERRARSCTSPHQPRSPTQPDTTCRLRWSQLTMSTSALAIFGLMLLTRR